MLHHTLPSYKKIRSRSTFRFNKFLRSRSKSTSGIGSGYHEKLPDQVRGDAGRPSAFSDPEDPRNPVADYELGRVKPVKTYISGKRDKDISEDGIYLKYDLRQGWHDTPGRLSGSAHRHGSKEADTMSEVVEADMV